MQAIDFWAITHQGLKRTNNEDAYLWLTPDDTDDQGYLWVVCDGMGGEAAGERAAHIVLERIKEVYGPALASTQSPHQALKETLQAANRRLLYVSEEHPELAGMGSTVAAVALYEDRLWVASVGDSRVYGWTPQGLTQWTVDHSKYETLREHGVLRPEDEREDHPARSVLMNVIGREKMYVDTLDERHFSPEDCALLLCSDGLSGHIRPKELRVAFASLNAQDAARFLMSAVLQRSRDNITVQVVRFTPPITPRSIEDVADSLGVTLLDGARDPHWIASGQHIDLTEKSARSDEEEPTPKATPGVPEKPVTQEVVLPPQTHDGSKGRTVLISPDALSNVFGNAPKDSDEGTGEITQRRVEAKGGTVLLSPDALSEAQAKMAEQKDAKKDASKPPASEAEAITSKPIATLDPPRYTTLSTSSAANHDAPKDAPPSEHSAPRRHLTVPPSGEARDAYAAIVDTPQEDAPPAARRTWLWLLVVLLALLIAAGIVWYVQRTAVEDAAAPEDTAPEASDASEDTAARSLPQFQPAAQPSEPEMMHEIDNMPAFRVADGAWWIDAHEVTVAQVQRVRDALHDDENVQALVQTLPCFGHEEEEAADHADHPACMSPIAAEAYCVAVGRRLPTEAAWTEIIRSDDARIARGYDRVFERKEDGPPPAYPQDSAGILGVYDGLPEVLAINDTQRRYGDLVLLAPTDDALTRTDAGAANVFEDPTKVSTQMVGVRCMMHDDDTSTDDEEPAPAAERSRRSDDAKNRGDEAPAANQGTREAGGIDPRVDAPDEAPMDPDIPDRSRILEYMKEQQNR